MYAFGEQELAERKRPRKRCSADVPGADSDEESGRSA
jgi:hypothetical protein